MLKRVIEADAGKPFLSYENKITEAIYTEIFCDVDDFYQSFEQHCRSIPQLTAVTGEPKM